MRAVAREVAFKIIHEGLFLKNDDWTEHFENDNLVEQDDIEFATQIAKLFFENQEKIEEVITKNLKDYVLERIYKVDRAIISLATAEMKFYKQTPDAVVINEAVKMAKKFGTEKSYSFVNAILKSIKEESFE